MAAVAALCLALTLGAAAGMGREKAAPSLRRKSSSRWRRRGHAPSSMGRRARPAKGGRRSLMRDALEKAIGIRHRHHGDEGLRGGEGQGLLPVPGHRQTDGYQREWEDADGLLHLSASCDVKRRPRWTKC